MNKLVPSSTTILSNYKGVCGLVQSTSPSGYIPLPKSVQSNPLVSGLGTESPSIEKPNPEVQVAEKAASLTQVGRGRRRRRAVSQYNPKKRRQQRGVKKRRKVARKQRKRVAKPRRKSRTIRKRRGRKVIKKARKSVLTRKKITRRRRRRTVKKQKRRTNKRSGRGAQFPGIVIENPVI